MAGAITQCFSNSVPDEATDTLQLLTLELPDCDQDLFTQYLVLFTFTLFQDLPTELRLMIWTLSLPRSRIVDLVWESFWLRHDPTKNNPPRLPNLLSVNQESRQTAMNEYQIFYTNMFSQPTLRKAVRSWSTNRKRPMCFSPSHDLFHMPTIMNHLIINRFDQMYRNNDQVFGKITELAITGVNRRDFRSTPFGRASNGSIQISLKYFPSLQRVYLIFCAKNFKNDWFVINGYGFTEEACIRAIINLCIELKEEEPWRLVPDVILLLDKKVDRSIWESRMDTNIPTGKQIL